VPVQTPQWHPPGRARHRHRQRAGAARWPWWLPRCSPSV